MIVLFFLFGGCRVLVVRNLLCWGDVRVTDFSRSSRSRVAKDF